MPTRPATLLRQLEATRLEYGPGRAAAKLALLERLARTGLASARQVLRLHEHLCFVRAYPDSREVLAQADRMLTGFARRGDLRRHRDELADSGVAGCDIRYRFFWPTARWLAARWPGQLAIDWDEVDDPDKLAAQLPLLVTPLEATWLRIRKPAPRVAVDRLRGRATDGAFYVRRVEAMPGDDFTREASFDGVEAPFVLRPAPGTPSRTHARYERAPVVFRKRAPPRGRPDLRAELARPPRSVRAVSATAGQRLIDLAQEAMVTRARDLDAFAYGDPRDVRVVDDGDGLRWALIGTTPERRPVLRATYGQLALRNGVPIAYAESDMLFGCADLAYNTFETFRGGESAFVFARLLAMLRQLFGAQSFTFEPYQLGRENNEALASGAWWFYYKLGFRPRSVAIRALVRTELARIRRDPAYRSAKRTLARLAEDYLYFEPDGHRAAFWPQLAELGARLAPSFAADAGTDREAAVQACMREAARLLGVSSLRAIGPGARAAWERWAPIVTRLPGLEGWSADERSALARIAFAKGGRRDSDYLALFDAHPKLGAALRRMTGA
jgi:hypothetical protein